MTEDSVIVNLPKKLDEFLAKSERILGCAIGDKNGDFFRNIEKNSKFKRVDDGSQRRNRSGRCRSRRQCSSRNQQKRPGIEDPLFIRLQVRSTVPFICNQTAHSENQTVSTVPTSTKVSFSSNLLLLTKITGKQTADKESLIKTHSLLPYFFTQFRSQLQY